MYRPWVARIYVLIPLSTTYSPKRCCILASWCGLASCPPHERPTLASAMDAKAGRDCVADHDFTSGARFLRHIVYWPAAPAVAGRAFVDCSPLRASCVFLHSAPSSATSSVLDAVRRRRLSSKRSDRDAYYMTWGGQHVEKVVLPESQDGHHQHHQLYPAEALIGVPALRDDDDDRLRHDEHLHGALGLVGRNRRRWTGGRSRTRERCPLIWKTWSVWMWAVNRKSLWWP